MSDPAPEDNLPRIVLQRKGQLLRPMQVKAVFDAAEAVDELVRRFGGSCLTWVVTDDGKEIVFQLVTPGDCQPEAKLAWKAFKKNAGKKGLFDE